MNLFAIQKNKNQILNAGKNGALKTETPAAKWAGRSRNTSHVFVFKNKIFVEFVIFYFYLYFWRIFRVFLSLLIYGVNSKKKNAKYLQKPRCMGICLYILMRFMNKSVQIIVAHCSNTRRTFMFSIINENLYLEIFQEFYDSIQLDLC